MGLWDDLTSWIDPTVDWVAEAFNYEDDTFIDITGQRTDKPYFTQPSFKQKSRTVGQLTSGSRAYMQTSPITGNPVNIGYANPDVRSYLTQLAQSSYNQQMNNMFASYLVSPTKTSGQKTIGIGSTTVKGTSTKTKTKTGRSARGLG